MDRLLNALQACGSLWHPDDHGDTYLVRSKRGKHQLLGEVSVFFFLKFQKGFDPFTFSL